MSSNLECVGLGVSGEAEFTALVEVAAASGTRLGERNGVAVVRWQDPGGARLILGVRRGRVIEVLPSFDSRPGARLSEVRMVNDDVATARVDDEDGEQVTAAAVEVEQRRLMQADPVACAASIVALGVDISIHADEAAFAASDASLLTKGDPDGESPAEYLENGLTWPPRVAAESFISYGVFGDPASSDAHALLCGTVLSVAEHRTQQTGHRFQVARVRTVGFEADVCLEAAAHPDPVRPGQIVAGTAFLVADLAWTPAPVIGPRRRAFFRRG